METASENWRAHAVTAEEERCCRQMRMTATSLHRIRIRSSSNSIRLKHQNVCFAMAPRGLQLDERPVGRAVVVYTVRLPESTTDWLTDCQTTATARDGFWRATASSRAAFVRGRPEAWSSDRLVDRVVHTNLHRTASINYKGRLQSFKSFVSGAAERVPRRRLVSLSIRHVVSLSYYQHSYMSRKVSN